MTATPAAGTLGLSVPDLRAAVAGRVIAPDDADYDAARLVLAADVDRRPAAIVRVAGVADVQHVVSLARETGMELAVRSGGHSGAGHGVCEGGLVIDLRDMRAIAIDPDARTAWAEPGLTASEVTRAAAQHGLAIGFGDTGSVGIGGITLGGGVGYLVRKHGLTIDDLLAVELVTADGTFVRADAEAHPDLFWALRGGGGNFGVVTRFLYRLHPLPDFIGGILVLPATPEVVASFVALAEAAPDELSTIANVMNCPPMPFVPEEAHGSLVTFAMLAYAGDVDEGERALAPFRTLAEPIADLVKPMPYADMYPPEEDAAGEGGYRPMAVARTMFVDAIDETAARVIVERLEASDASLRAVQIRVLGGAMSRVPVDATAFAHRGRRIMINVAAFYDGPDDRAAREAWVVDTVAALGGSDAAAYVNFIGNEGAARVRDAYPGATWDRLADVKARYDPTNVFRVNHNVPPAGRDGEMGEGT